MNFYASLSGLTVAQKAIDLIGTNISNAATESYHRQEIQLTPVEYSGNSTQSLGGVRVSGITRSVDEILEREILRQEPLLGQTAQELETLHLIERSLGNLDANRLSESIDGFFNSITELAAHPSEDGYQQAMIEAGKTLSFHFRDVSQFLSGVSEQIIEGAEGMVSQANSLLEEIAGLNLQISSGWLRGSNNNVLMDQRGEALEKLTNLMNVSLDYRSDRLGAINVSIDGASLISGGEVTRLGLEIGADQRFSVVLENSGLPVGVTSGRIGGLLNLRNDLIDDITSQLDKVAVGIIDQINAIHIQGVGEDGSFNDLVGWPSGAPATELSDISSKISTGTLRIRITDTATGSITIEEIQINDLTATFSDLATDFDGLAGLGAWLDGSSLHLKADNGFEFDFLPVSDAEFGGGWNGTSTIGVDGILSNPANEDFTVTVIGGGNVGVTSGLQLRVENAAGDTLAIVDVGDGYQVDQPLRLANGIEISLSAGQILAGESFTIHGIVTSDETGILAALGINTFLSGGSADTFDVSQSIVDNPRLIAGAVGSGMADNVNFQRMSAITDQAISSLGGSTINEYYRGLVTGVARDIVVREAKQRVFDNIAQQLALQRDEISGVDVNDEAAKLIVFERMFQAVAKVLSVQNQTLQALFNSI